MTESIYNNATQSSEPGTHSKAVLGMMYNEFNPTIELFTRPAIDVWNGKTNMDQVKLDRRISGTNGFDKFLRKVHNMEDAIRKDDPYADKYYFLCEQLLNERRVQLSSMSETLNKLMAQSHARLTLPSPKMATTFVAEIKDQSRLGFQCVELLLSADDAIAKSQEAFHYARISKREKDDFVYQAKRAVRGVLDVVRHYSYCDVTRDDIAANNASARRAKERMGELETSFLNGDLRSEFAPVLPKRRRNTLVSESTHQSDTPSTETSGTKESAA